MLNIFNLNLTLLIFSLEKSKRNTHIYWKKVNGIGDLLDQSDEIDSHDEKQKTGFKYTNPTLRVAEEINDMRKTKKITAIMRNDIKKE